MFRSDSMVATWFAEDDTSKISSAKRRLVNLDRVWPPRWIPIFCCSQRDLRVRITCSVTLLKSRELRGSPCLTPRCIVKCLLVRSVRTDAVWLEYRFASKLMYDRWTPCSASAAHMLACATLSKALLKSTVATHKGSCHSSAVSCNTENVNRWPVVLRPGRKPD